MYGGLIIVKILDSLLGIVPPDIPPKKEPKYRKEGVMLCPNCELRERVQGKKTRYAYCLECSREKSRAYSKKMRERNAAP